MYSFKFGQIEISSEDFHKNRQTADIYSQCNKIGFSDEITYNNGRDWRYIIGYQVDEVTIILLFIKAPKTYLATTCINTKGTQLIQYHLTVLRYQNGCFIIETSGMRLSSSCLKS